MDILNSILKERQNKLREDTTHASIESMISMFEDDAHPCQGLSEDDPCWKDYEQIGMKKKNGKKVPNCVPKEESVEEGKLVTTVHDIVGVIMKKVAAKLEADYEKNPEKGIGMINTIGAIIKHKVTDKKQEKGKLFLKFGDNLEGDELFEDAAVDAAELKAKQAGELERLKQRQEDELEALTKRHEREQERVDGQKEKETADKQIQAKRDADRKKSEAQSESFKTLLRLRGIK